MQEFGSLIIQEPVYLLGFKSFELGGFNVRKAGIGHGNTRHLGMSNFALQLRVTLILVLIIPHITREL